MFVLLHKQATGTCKKSPRSTRKQVLNKCLTIVVTHTIYNSSTSSRKELLALRKRPLQTLCIFMVIYVFQKNSYNTLSHSLQKISLTKCKFVCFFYSNFSFQSTYLFQPFRQSIKFSLSCKATLYLIQGLCNAQVNCKIILHCKKNVTRCGARWQTFLSAWPSCFDN